VSARVAWALVSSVWREKLAQPGLLVLFAFLTLGPVGVAIMEQQLPDPTSFTSTIALIMAAGSVGRDVSTGVLPLLFTRPLVRTTYLLAKWLGTSIAATVLAAASVGVQAVILARTGHGAPGMEIVAKLFACATTAFGTCAVLVALSVLVNGYANVGLYIILSLVPSIPRVPQRLAQEWRHVVGPSLAWESVAGSATSWLDVVAYLSTVTLLLAAAALVLNRKELSYASAAAG
jgi:hypothetical protein